MDNIYLSLLYALLLTIVLEELFAIVLYKIKNIKDLINIMLINMLTNPLLNGILIYINVFYGNYTRTVYLYVLEIVVVIVEGLYYKLFLSKVKFNPFVISLFLNIFSYLFGNLISKFYL